MERGEEGLVVVGKDVEGDEEELVGRAEDEEGALRECERERGADGSVRSEIGRNARCCCSTTRGSSSAPSSPSCGCASRSRWSCERRDDQPVRVQLEFHEAPTPHLPRTRLN